MAVFGSLSLERKACPWRLSLFGQVRLEGENGAGRTFGSSNLGRLLALLVEHEGRELPKLEVIDQIWPERNLEDARNSLRVCVHEVRRTFRDLGHVGDVVSGDHHTLRLVEGVVETDVETFRKGIKAARASTSTKTKIINLETALREVQGEYLPGIEDPWATVRRRGVEDEIVTAAVELIELLNSIGKPDDALAIGRTMLRAFKSREELHRAVMRTYGFKGEPGEAFRQYDVLSRVLDAEFGLGPSKATDETLENLPEALAGSAGARALTEACAAETRRALVPRFAASRFVGREAQLADLGRWLHPLADRSSRLVSVTGLNGMGKSRLCAEACETLRDAYADRVWYAELPAVVTSEGYWAVLLEAIAPDRPPGSSPEKLVRAELGKGPALIAIDCEGTAPLTLDPFLERLLSDFSDLRVVSALQVRLGLEAERVLALKPMSVPKAGAPWHEAEEVESFRLFVDRASRANREFRVDEETARAVTEICRAMAGLPLAVQLAAGLVGVYGPEGLASSLTDLKLLRRSRLGGSPNRNGGLQEAFEWSLDQLEPRTAERLTDLSVFAKGFDMEAAVQVLGDEDLRADFPDLLDGGWLERRSTGRGPRFELLEPVQTFLESKLKDSGRLEGLRAGHRRYYESKALRIGAEWKDGDRTSLADQAFDDLPNSLAAVQSGLGGGADVEAACRIVGGLAQVFNFRAHPAAWFRAVRSAVQAVAGLETEEAATANGALAILAFFEFDFELMYRSASRQTAILEKRKASSSETASALTRLALANRALERFDDAVVLYRKAIVLERRGGKPTILHQARYNLALLLEATGRPGALRQYRKAARESEDQGDVRFIGLAANSLARLARLQGDLRTSLAASRRALEVLELGHDDRAKAFVQNELAMSLLQSGQTAEAVCLASRALESAMSMGEYNLARSTLSVLASGMASFGNGTKAALAVGVFEHFHSRVPVRPYEEDVERVSSVQAELTVPVFQVPRHATDLTDVLRPLFGLDEASIA
ncbi:MAG: winged helix-turn-helix domain-containing protein [Armatimonadetes bacterium]|nr:winged helix-turn-helix domain-containing protein [Armatimonadota bacterium]